MKGGKFSHMKRKESMMSDRHVDPPQEWRLLLDQIEDGERKIEELSDEELEIVAGGYMQASGHLNIRITTQVVDPKTDSFTGP